MYSNKDGSPANIHQVLVDWDENIVYADVAPGGFDEPGTEYVAIADGLSDPPNEAWFTWDMAAGLAAWSAGTSVNKGWVFIATGGTSWQFYTSDRAEVSEHPWLEVDYTPPGLYINSFAIAAQSGDGGSLFTTTNTVDVTSLIATPEAPDAVDGYAVNDTGAVPGAFALPAPTTATFTAPGTPGMVTLYGWAHDTGGNTAGREATILYNPNAVGVAGGGSGVVITSVAPTQAEVTWTSDSLAHGRLQYSAARSADPVSMTDWSAAGTDHTVLMTGLAMGTRQRLPSRATPTATPSSTSST